MSWYLNESNIKLNIAKRKIISSLLVNNYELVSICFCKLYTAGSNNKTWLYTGLEGGLTLVIDYRRKTARFLLFDLNTLEIVFENEFYRKFNIFYSSLSENFQCFEVAGGFIGFNIPDKYDAEKFFKSVFGLTDQTIARKAKDIKIINILDIKNNAKKMLSTLQEKLNEEYFFKENLAYESNLDFDFNHLEKVFQSIEYDLKAKSFSVTGSDDEIRNLVNNIDGIKIKDDKDQRIADPKAYIAELYKNFQNTDKLIKKKEAEQPKTPKQMEKQLVKDEKPVAVSVPKDNPKEKKSDQNSKEVPSKPAAVIQKNTEKDNKNQSVNPVEIKSTNVPKPPPMVPTIPSVNKPPGANLTPKAPSVPQVPKAPGVPSVPGIPGGIPKPPAIPSISSIPKPPANNALLQAIQHAGENKNALLKKPPVINDRSAPIIKKDELSDNLKSEISSLNPNQNAEGEQTNNNNNTKKAQPMDMMSELRMRMANRMKKPENPPAEQKVNVTNNNENNNNNAFINQANKEEKINIAINSTSISVNSTVNISTTVNINQTEENVPRPSMKTGMAAMIEQMNKKFGGNKPTNVIVNNNNNINAENNTTNTDNTEASSNVPSGASTIAKSPRIDKDKFSEFAKVAQNNLANKLNANLTSNPNASNIISIPEPDKNSESSTSSQTEPKQKIEINSAPTLPKQTPVQVPSTDKSKVQSNTQKPAIPNAPSVPSAPKAPVMNASVPNAPKAPVMNASVPNAPKAPVMNASVPNAPKAPVMNASIPKPPPIAPMNPGIPNAGNLDRPKPPSLNLLASAITGGAIKLKKTETVDKSGLDYLKKKNSVTKDSTSSEGNTSGGKSDLFSEMRKIALKRAGK